MLIMPRDKARYNARMRRYMREYRKRKKAELTIQKAQLEFMRIKRSEEREKQQPPSILNELITTKN